MSIQSNDQKELVITVDTIELSKEYTSEIINSLIDLVLNQDTPDTESSYYCLSLVKAMLPSPEDYENILNRKHLESNYKIKKNKN